MFNTLSMKKLTHNPIEIRLKKNMLYMIKHFKNWGRQW